MCKCPPPLEDLACGQAGAVSRLGIFGVVNGGHCEKNEKVYVEEDRGHIWHKEAKSLQVDIEKDAMENECSLRSTGVVTGKS